MVTADLTGDGIPDLAVQGYDVTYGTSVRVLVGLGDGRFLPGQVIPNAAIAEMTTGDLNGDGREDLIGVSHGYISIPPSPSYPSYVYPYYGTASGSLTTGSPILVGGDASSITLTNLNGDSHADLLVTDLASSRVRILLGLDGQHFQLDSTSTAGPQPAAVAAGDLNTDGLPDLVVTNPSVDSASVFLGTGPGNFAPRHSFVVSGGPTQVVIANLNGDPKPDLAIGLRNIGRPLLLYGAGDGTFPDGEELYLQQGSGYFTVGDFNGDGHSDVAAPDDYLHAAVLYVGNGAGSFTLRSNTMAGRDPNIVVSGDWNGDGKRDLAMTAKAGMVTVLLANGDGTFGNGTELDGQYLKDVQTGDVDGDGDLDIVAVDASPGGFRVYRNDGHASFADPQFFFCGDGALQAGLGDLNEDGKLDVAVGSYTSPVVSVFLGNGDGTFPSSQPIGMGRWPGSIALLDVNEDSHLDLISADWFDNSISVRLGAGDGSFGTRSVIGTQVEPRWLTSGDFDRDGHIDLVAVCEGTPRVCIHPGRGDGTFRPRVEYLAGDRPHRAAVGDLNLDGYPDVVTGGWQLGMLLGTATGALQPWVALPGSGEAVAIQDVDRDSRPDVVTTVFEQAVVWVLGGRGDGTFAPRIGFGAGFGPSAIAGGDLDGDGSPDLAVTSENLSKVTVLLNSGKTTPALASPTEATAEPGRVQVTWWIGSSFQGQVEIERRSPLDDWQRRATVASSGGWVRFVDEEVGAAGKYGYRIGADGVYSGEVWVDIPTASAAPSLVLDPNPASAPPMVSFMPPGTGDAFLEVFSAGGRLIQRRVFHISAPARFSFPLNEISSYPAGLYFVQLRQGSSLLRSKFVFVR